MITNVAGAVTVKMTSRALFWALAVAAALHLLGAASFMKGFMLSRVGLKDRSTCAPLPPWSGDESNAFVLVASEGECWTPAVVQKVVVVVIDALRHDMIFPRESAPSGERLPRFETVRWSASTSWAFYAACAWRGLHNPAHRCREAPRRCHAEDEGGHRGTELPS